MTKSLTEVGGAVVSASSEGIPGGQGIKWVGRRR